MHNKYNDDGYTNYINIENKEYKRECECEINGRNAKKSYYECTCKTIWLITIL